MRAPRSRWTCTTAPPTQPAQGGQWCEVWGLRNLTLVVPAGGERIFGRALEPLETPGATKPAHVADSSNHGQLLRRVELGQGGGRS